MFPNLSIMLYPISIMEMHIASYLYNSASDMKKVCKIKLQEDSVSENVLQYFLQLSIYKMSYV